MTTPNIFDVCAFDWSGSKNLGAEYNRLISALPDDAHICLRDGDTCWLTHDYGVHLAEYVRLYPDAVLTCWTNRINEKAEQQYKEIPKWAEPGFNVRTQPLMRYHLQIAKDVQSTGLYKVTPLHGFVSGFCLVFPKSLWMKNKFAEKQVYEDRGPHNMLGVDNDWTNRVRAAGVPVLRMDGIYIWHTYRLLQGDKDKTHLL